jgi:hypothetical protein
MYQLLFVFTELDLEYLFDYYIILLQINGDYNKLCYICN